MQCTHEKVMQRSIDVDVTLVLCSKARDNTVFFAKFYRERNME